MSYNPGEILEKYWGFTAFRPLQKEIISSVLEGNDTLALLPTGGGKSICFQVPTLAQEGLCLVVSPLISLMKDQVANLNERGISAAAVFSGMSYREVDTTLNNAMQGQYKFLYLSPERLETEIFLERVARMPVKLLAVDEAHCISQWGYDFRPPYLRIAEVRKFFPGVPVLALTATATERVRDDICEKLEFRKKQVFRKSFDRPNLIYAVLDEEDKYNRLLKLLQKVKGTAIIYMRSRKATEAIAGFLKRNGIPAEHYHAGLNGKERSQRQEDWMTGKKRIIVATTAFGMGIDKPDVRLVVHLDLPESLEAYYQEAGRAGRDEKRSFAISIVNNADRLKLQKKQADLLPSREEIRNVYEALCNYLQVPLSLGKNESFDLDLPEFSRRFNFKPMKAHSALKLLEVGGYITLNEAVFLPSRLKMLMDYRAVYEFEVAHKRFEPLIKSILRSYGGAFENYVNVIERDLARKTQKHPKEISEQLRELQKLGVVDYQQQKEKPQVFFNLPRQHRKEILTDPQVIEQRLKLQKEKTEWVVKYFFGDQPCRSQVLLRYFDEKLPERCGHCDRCLKKKETGLSDEEFGRIRQKTIALLSKRPQPLQNIITGIPGESETKIAEVVRWMLSEEELRADAHDNICLTGGKE